MKDYKLATLRDLHDSDTPYSYIEQQTTEYTEFIFFYYVLPRVGGGVVLYM